MNKTQKAEESCAATNQHASKSFRTGDSAFHAGSGGESQSSRVESAFEGWSDTVIHEKSSLRWIFRIERLVDSVRYHGYARNWVHFLLVALDHMNLKL